MASIEPLRNSMMSIQAQNSSGKTIGNLQEKPVLSKEADTESEFKMPDNVTPFVDAGSATASSSGESMQKDTASEQEEQLAKKNEQLRKSVEQLNKSLPDSEVLFGYHEVTHRVTLKIVDKETKKVIRELPPEETLDMIAKVWELAGMLVDEKR